MQLDSFGNNWGGLILYILLCLIVTIIAYGTFPLVYAMTRKKPIVKQRYSKICHFVNVLPAIIFFLFDLELNLLPYFLWTELSVKYGLNQLEDRGLLEDADPAPGPNQAYRCRGCGYQSRGYFEACPRCGKFGKEIVTDEVLPLPRYHYCASCGKPLASGVRFCGHCGSRVQEKE